MAKIDILNIEPSCDTTFIVPHKITYIEEGVEKVWEVVKSHDSVAILIYKEDTQEFVLVKQFRPAVYMNNNDGYTVELCAGIEDKKIPRIEIAKEEILEETGFDVHIDAIQEINTFYTSVGFSGAKQTLYFVRVCDANYIDAGGGVVGEENIEVIYISIYKAKEFIQNTNVVKTPGLMYAFYWFFDNIET